MDLYWLPVAENWKEAIAAIDRNTDRQGTWRGMVALANTRLDFIQTIRLDRSLQKRFADAPPEGIASKPVRLAILSSSTTGHLAPALRVAALRHGLWLAVREPVYGQYVQELADPASGLHAFAPDAVLVALDAYHVLRGADAAMSAEAANAWLEGAVAGIVKIWRAARKSFGAFVIQQTILPVFPALLGHNEHRLPGSPARLVARLNERLREAAETEGVHLLAIDQRAAADGMRAWHDPALWHRAKQEIVAPASPFYGDLVARLLAAAQGRSRKCLVLDLDNTVWGGVIGDDGLAGIVLGQGSARGEAFAAFQNFALDLSKRGVILAVCSKNDEANALEPFRAHPEMVLREPHIACFVANWQDKAGNIRRIAKALNIGLDSLVFVDDNPFERNLVRGEVPEVAVPEIPADPGLVAAAIADAGYFESLALTEEDRERTAQYRANLARQSFAGEATDLPAYLRGLDMRLIWRRFDPVGQARTTQLINKTNQFNLTTRRYTDEQVRAVMASDAAFGLQLRLLDRFGDNGIIAIVIGRLLGRTDVLIDTWLMSCRVLGRQVEEATLGLVMAQAAALGATRLIGEYLPTAKNAMVKDHYTKLGFTPVPGEEGHLWEMDPRLPPPTTFIHVEEG